MAVKSVRELALAMSDNERRALRDSLEKSLQINQGNSGSIIHTKDDAESRKAFIQSRMQKFSLWQKLVLFFRKLFRSSTENEIVFEMVMEQMVRRIQNRGWQLVKVETRQLEPAFAGMVYSLYGKVLPLISLFGRFWQNPQLLQNLVSYILETRIPEAKSSIYRFANFTELQTMFEKLEKKSLMKQELNRRIEAYVKSIPKEVFVNIEQGMLPLYYYRELILFDFQKFFRAFGVSILNISRGGDPGFQQTAVMPLLGELEQLYYAVYAARRGNGLVSLHTEIFEFFQVYAESPEAENYSAILQTEKRKEEDEAKADPDQAIADAKNAELEAEFSQLPPEFVRTEHLERDQKKVFREAADAVEDFWQKSLLGNIIRYFRKDPNYRFIAYAPQLQLFDFYLGSLRLKIFDELDTEYSSIRQEVIAQKKSELFPAKRHGFEFYRRNPNATASTKLPIFRYFDTLTTLYQFLHYCFDRSYVETFRVLSRILPERYRELGSRLILTIAGTEELIDKLRAFDYTFSPMSDEGKSFFRTRFAAEKDISQLKAYRVVISQKDQEARGYLDRGNEQLRNMLQIVGRLQAANLEAIDERFHELSSVTDFTLKKHLAEISENLEKVLRILYFEQQMEEELRI